MDINDKLLNSLKAYLETQDKYIKKLEENIKLSDEQINLMQQVIDNDAKIISELKSILHSAPPGLISDEKDLN